MSLMAPDPIAPGSSEEFLLSLIRNGRRLQQPQLPNYTSPALPDAIADTPEAFRDNQVIDEARAAAAAKNCSLVENKCMIPFIPTGFDASSPTLGVLWYGGALVDPRSYAPLARRLATRYGLPVLIPIFDRDIAFVSCSTGRIEIARQVLPNVEKWILVGHSFGGTAAMADLWEIVSNETSQLSQMGGLVLLGSDVNPDLGCGPINFSKSELPMATVTASNDRILNRTRWEDNRWNLPQNGTFFLDILDGNHGGFGSYNYSERTPLLGQVDGPMLIAPAVQFDLTTAAVAQVASRSGVPLPTVSYESQPNCSSTSGAVITASLLWTENRGPWAAVLLVGMFIRHFF